MSLSWRVGRQGEWTSPRLVRLRGSGRTLQCDPLPPLWCHSKFIVHRWEDASINASVHAERAFQNRPPSLLRRLHPQRPSGAMARRTGTLKHILARLKLSECERHSVPRNSPPGAPVSKRAGRSLHRKSIRCASSALYGATTSRLSVLNGIANPSTTAARRNEKSGAHCASTAPPSDDMAPASTVHAAQGVSCWSSDRGTKR